MDTVRADLYMTKGKVLRCETDSNKNVMPIAFSYLSLRELGINCNHVQRFLLLSSANIYKISGKETKRSKKIRFFSDYKVASAVFCGSAYKIEYTLKPHDKEETKQAVVGVLTN